MVVATQANASSTTNNVKVVAGTTSKMPVFSGNHSDDWTIWEMKILAHLMEKRLDTSLDLTFETRLPNKESGPFNMTVEDKKNQKEAVDMNKKAMCQFIQAFSTMSLLIKVNLQKKADKNFPSERVWKLWAELQSNFNPDDSIAETELELALGKLKLTNKKNPQNLLEEIASCEVKHGVPVSDGKKVAQLIRLGGKKYGTVITVTQMCKKSEKVTCTTKHIVEEMWKQWRIEGGKEKGKENADDEDGTTLSKVDEKNKHKGKDRLKEKDDKGKKKETRTCNHCQMKGHIEVNCWKKNPLHSRLRNSQARKQKRLERR